VLKTYAEFLAEHTTISEGVENPVFVKDKSIKEIDSMVVRGNVPKQTLVSKITTAYDAYKHLFSTVKSDLERMVKADIYKYQKTKFLTDIKSLKSVVDKAVDRHQGIGGLGDLVRGAVLFDTKEDADVFVKKFVHSHKDKIVEYEEKVRGNDPVYGYFGSHHIKLIIDGLFTELQIMTRKLWTYKDAAHQIYDKYRSSGHGPDKFDANLSKHIFAVANESVDMPVEFTIGELEEMYYDNWKEVDLS
jgi:hypothetical protein